MGAPGTMPGDRALYAGRKLLGTVRGSVSGVVAYNAEGRVLGTYSSEKAAKDAINALHRREDGHAGTLL